MSKLIPEEVILTKVYRIRGQKVMLDRDLAQLYGVETSQFNRAVKRNINRFPNDFMFQLTKDEWEFLRCQIGISKKGSGGRRYWPYVFTQEGIAMLSGVLNSPQAVQVNITIMRVFVKLREIMMAHKDLTIQYNELRKTLDGHDKTIRAILEAMRRLQEPEQKPKGNIGFHK